MDRKRAIKALLQTVNELVEMSDATFAYLMRDSRSYQFRSYTRIDEENVIKATDITIRL